MSNKLDIMKYGKARGTFLAQKYLPNISPFVKIDLILIDEKKYNNSREERIDFLIRRCNYDRKLLEREIPKKYVPINDYIIRKVIDDIILVLYLAKKDLLLDNLRYFCVQGNIIDMKLEPWELSTLDRLV